MDLPPSSSPNVKSGYPDPTPRMKDLPDEMKPREEFERRGADHVSNATLLAILLRSGLPGQNVQSLANAVLHHFGGLDELAKVDLEELKAAKIRGLGKVKCLELAAAMEIGRRTNHSFKASSGIPTIKEPRAVYTVIAPLALSLKQERFWTILLDSKSKIIGQPIVVSTGLLDATLVHPREVFAKAIRYHAAAVILAHNHPSGDPTPSTEDIQTTRRMIEAARIIGIQVFDHVIIGKPGGDGTDYLSMREKNLLSFSQT